MRHTRSIAFAVLALAALLMTGCAGRYAPRPFPSPTARPPSPAAPASVAPQTAGAEPSGLLETALSALGTPYRAGGETPDAGFDCSGFVEWVFRQHGLALPRTVAAQFASGEAVHEPPAIAAADLVFFTASRGDPTHVGIALGDGRFVHAPSSKGVVRIEPLSAAYWSRHFVGARRIVIAPQPTTVPTETGSTR